MTAEKMMTLLPCPFCGSPACKIGPYGEGLFGVQCLQCNAGVRGYDQCQQDAVDAWNTRSSAVGAGAREALKEALGLALGILSKGEPPDSRAVSNEFVAMAAVHCDDYSDNVMEIIRKAQQTNPRPG